MKTHSDSKRLPIAKVVGKDFAVCRRAEESWVLAVLDDKARESLKRARIKRFAFYALYAIPLIIGAVCFYYFDTHRNEIVPLSLLGVCALLYFFTPAELFRYGTASYHGGVDISDTKARMLVCLNGRDSPTVCAELFDKKYNEEPENKEETSESTGRFSPRRLWHNAQWSGARSRVGLV